MAGYYTLHVDDLVTSQMAGSVISSKSYYLMWIPIASVTHQLREMVSPQISQQVDKRVWLSCSNALTVHRDRALRAAHAQITL